MVSLCYFFLSLSKHSLKSSSCPITFRYIYFEILVTDLSLFARFFSSRNVFKLATTAVFVTFDFSFGAWWWWWWLCRCLCLRFLFSSSVALRSKYSFYVYLTIFFKVPTLLTVISLGPLSKNGEFSFLI